MRRPTGFYTSVAWKKFARVQLLTIEGPLNDKQRAEHPDYEPDLNFKKAKAEPESEQQNREMAASLGLEPRQSDSESLVLPLHHEAMR